MKNIFSIQTRLLLNIVSVVIVAGFIHLMASCTKDMEGQTYRVYDDKMIDEILVGQNLTSFLSIVDKAEFSGTIHACGAYTLFVPTNEAIATYLQSIGKESVDQLTKEESEAIVKYHLIANDTIKTADLVDGRLKSRNYMKKFLTTKAQSDGSIIVDRKAKIVTKQLTGEIDLKGANGYVYVIDELLTPPTNSVTDLIRSLPDESYSILKSFFEKSGLADSLDSHYDNVWFTFFLQDDSTYTKAGITNDSTLLVQLHENQKSSVKTDAELIRDYVGYHVVMRSIPEYVVDLLSSSALPSLTPEKKPILFNRIGDQVWLNRLIVDKINEPGVQLDKTSEYTDLSCSNGVVHKILGNIQVKERSAYRVYWDLATQPEIMALANYRKAGTYKTYYSGELSEVTWGGTNLAYIEYGCGSIPKTESAFDPKFQYIYGDYLRFNLNSGTVKWIEFKLPVLMPGDYKVWVCYRRELDLKVKTTFKQEGQEDQVMPYIFNMAEYMPSGTPEQQELLGWKQYPAKAYNSVANSHILGTIKVYSEGRHTLRLEPITSARAQQWGNWDLIQFIPKEEDQTFPRVDMLGNWIEKDTPAWQIYPYGVDPNAAQ